MSLSALDVAAAQGGGFGSPLGFVFIIVMIAAFYFIAIRPQQKRRKETQSMLQTLAPGSEIVTIAGLHAKVVALEADDTVLLEVAPGVTCKYGKQAIARVIPAEAPAQENLPESTDDADDAKDTSDEVADKSDDGADEADTTKDDDAAVDEAEAKDDDASDDADPKADGDRRSSS